MEENGKRRKKGRSLLEIFAKENGKMFFPTCWIKNFFFFSARHNRIVKKCEAGRPFFKFFFFAKIFSLRRATTRRVNITRRHTKRERNKKKKKERGKVQRINYFLEAVFFFLTEKRDKEDIFQKVFENTDKWQKFFLVIMHRRQFESEKWFKSGKRCFSKRIILRKESMIF